MICEVMTCAEKMLFGSIVRMRSSSDANKDTKYRDKACRTHWIISAIFTMTGQTPTIADERSGESENVRVTDSIGNDRRC